MASGRRWGKGVGEGSSLLHYHGQWRLVGGSAPPYHGQWRLVGESISPYHGQWRLLGLTSGSDFVLARGHSTRRGTTKPTPTKYLTRLASARRFARWAGMPPERTNHCAIVARRPKCTGACFRRRTYSTSALATQRYPISHGTRALLRSRKGASCYFCSNFDIYRSALLRWPCLQLFSENFRVVFGASIPDWQP